MSMLNSNNPAISLEVENPSSEIENTKTPLLVDFFASWCGPCRAMSPILEDIQKEYGDSLKIIKVNIDDYPKLAEKYEVQSVPTFLFFSNGELISRESGFMPMEYICDIINSTFSIEKGQEEEN